MAELTNLTSLDADPSSCCSPVAQASCCAPSEKSACCETSAAGGACGCAARFAVSDVIADPGMDDATRADMPQYVGCIAGALTFDEYARHLTDAGFPDVEITETHRVHEHAGSAIIRARKPV